jgi:RNA recognition motif-containing protein
MDVPAAYAFNYHFDNGVFRGLAFANYRTAEETEIVVNTINGLEIGGRKLRVEYKRVLLPPPGSQGHSHSNSTSSSSNVGGQIPHSSSTSSLSQPSSPHMQERRLPSNPDEGNLTLYTV